MTMAQVYVLIVTRYGCKRQVSTELLGFDMIDNVHELYGQYDIIIRIKGKDMNQIEEFIAEHIRTNKDIQQTNTLVVSDIPIGG